MLKLTPPLDKVAPSGALSPVRVEIFTSLIESRAEDCASMTLDMASRSRYPSHIPQLCGHSRTYPNLQHSGWLCASRHPGHHTTRAVAGPHPNKTSDRPGACSGLRVLTRRREVERRRPV